MRGGATSGGLFRRLEIRRALGGVYHQGAAGNRLAAELRGYDYDERTQRTKLPFVLRNGRGEEVILSHVRGDTEARMYNCTIGSFFDQQEAFYNSEAALVSCHQELHWSWTELRRQILAFATGLQRLGYQKGDRLGVWLPNCAEWVVAKHACLRLGVILVNINPAYRVHELHNALNLVGLKGLVLTPHFKQSHYQDMLTQLMPELPSLAPETELNSPAVPSLRHLIHVTDSELPGMFRFSDVQELGARKRAEMEGERTRMEHSVGPHDAANIQFTSGTTGTPKGATLTHHNILNNGFFVGQTMGLRRGDRVCIPVPLYHCFGIVLGNMAALTHGACVVYPNAGFDAERTLKAVHDEKCTALYGVPTMFIQELNHPQFAQIDKSKLRTGIMAGTSCPPEIMRRVIRDMNMHALTICYGMTETSPVSFQTEPESTLAQRCETVGRVHPGVEAKIVDKEGQTVQLGEVGELLTRGYIVMQGYWNAPEATAKCIDEHGWMHTGDLATLDAEGYCRIVGRAKDMIIRGGENIYPVELEAFLHSHPHIDEVQVVGVPDPKYGEEVCAWVKLRPSGVEAGVSGEDIREWCREKIAHFKIPRYVLIKDEFPSTVTGKAQKFKIIEESIVELNLKQPN